MTRSIYLHSSGNQLRRYVRVALSPTGSSTLEIRRRTRSYFEDALKHLPTTTYRSRRQALAIARYDVRKMVLGSLLQDGTILPQSYEAGA